MAYAIAKPCIGTNDTACVGACPGDCIPPQEDHDPSQHQLDGCWCRW
jgi:NAD-dependent dihydropyrimidine dehydrogenase PreA subunit